MRTTAASLCEGDCAIRGVHESACVDEECRGCQRRRAADGLRLCELHTERIAEDAIEAPSLHADLGLTLVRRCATGEKTSGSARSAPVPDDATMEARITIRALLVRLTRLIVTQRAVRPPMVRRDGRRLVDSSTAALGPFVARHAAWLAATGEAGAHSRDLHEATRGQVRALAYPSGSDRLYLGQCPLPVLDRDGAEVPCGTRLFQRPDQPLIACLGCGVQDTFEQWQRWLFSGEQAGAGISDAYAIAAHLSLRWMRPVDASLLRSWSSRGHIQPVTRPDPTPGRPDHVAIDRDERHRTQYAVADVLAYAEQVWGRPVTAPPARAGRRLRHHGEEAR